MYKFPLESVLKCRENIEKKHAQELANIQLDHSNAIKDLRLLISYAEEISEKLNAEEKKGISPKEALLFHSITNKTKIDISKKETEINEINLLIEKKRKELNTASIEKKVVEKLKEKDRKKYLKEMITRHQKEMDEIAVSRYSKR